MNESETFFAGRTAVRIVDTEESMGRVTARKVADKILDALQRGARPALWLMAAPSAFAFYRSFVSLCEQDAKLRSAVCDIPIYQFDDYPVARGDARFPVTFRSLLEEYLYSPLRKSCGRLTGAHPMELTGTSRDGDIAESYGAEIAALLDDPDFTVIQVKGIGMDGHWGFHGADTPLDAPAGIINVPIGSQNVRQQRIDWPELFPTNADVPPIAYTATVSLFLRADYIVDNVPQPSKQYAVLASYGTDEILNEVPSSALKQHGNSEAILTRDAAGALLDYRDRLAQGHSTLNTATQGRLAALWNDDENPDAAEANRAIMRAVLEKLGLSE